jgi:methionine-gamma-lyase
MGTKIYSELFHNPVEEQIEMGLSDGLIRFSIGLDNDIERTYKMMKDCMETVGLFENISLD